MYKSHSAFKLMKKFKAPRRYNQSRYNILYVYPELIVEETIIICFTNKIICKTNFIFVKHL